MISSFVNYFSVCKIFDLQFHSLITIIDALFCQQLLELFVNGILENYTSSSCGKWKILEVNSNRKYEDNSCEDSDISDGKNDSTSDEEEQSRYSIILKHTNSS